MGNVGDNSVSMHVRWLHASETQQLTDATPVCYLCNVYNLMSLKLRTRNHPCPQGCFSGMPLIPVPIEGVGMSLKPSKWLFDIGR